MATVLSSCAIALSPASWMGDDLEHPESRTDAAYTAGEWVYTSIVSTHQNGQVARCIATSIGDTRVSR